MIYRVYKANILQKKINSFEWLPNPKHFLSLYFSFALWIKFPLEGFKVQHLFPANDASPRHIIIPLTTFSLKRWSCTFSMDVVRGHGLLHHQYKKVGEFFCSHTLFFLNKEFYYFYWGGGRGWILQKLDSHWWMLKEERVFQKWNRLQFVFRVTGSTHDLWSRSISFRGKGIMKVWECTVCIDT